MPPIVFLDKSPQVVAFQLNRLSNAHLLAIGATGTEAKYLPVLQAILLRPGMSQLDRQQALSELMKLSGNDAVSELLDAIGQTTLSRRGQRTVAKQLAAILLQQPAAALQKHIDKLQQATAAKHDVLRAVAFAALVSAGQAELAWKSAFESQPGRVDFLTGVELVRDAATRATLRKVVISCLAESQGVAVRRAAIEALAHVPVKQQDNFHLIAQFVGVPLYRASAVRTLSTIAKEFRSADDARQIVGVLTEHAEKTPAERRTSNEFLDAMQLADELLPVLPVEEARQFRARLREAVVRVVRINTVEEEMRYDTPYFAVEAGRPVQLVLRNEDLMPHNLVITVPGAMREVAELAATLPPTVDKQGRQYVPDTPQLLHAMRMVPPQGQDVLTFTAPTEPGEYPYVCTFPRHWMRMYGVMVVVNDLDAWLANPTKPADPLGQNRDFVQNWTVDDLRSELSTGLLGRNAELGQRIFREASCQQCHKFAGEGGAVGPELTDVMQRWKGDHEGILREILDPSHKIEPKYALYNVLTVKGKVISGVVTAQDRDTVTLVSNPENPVPQVIQRDDIDEMIKTSSSLMPKGLLNRFSKDEIFELLAFITRTAQQGPQHQPGSSD